ncbi:MAG: NfeD-like protein [Limnospira sp. PMC 1291.21]|uniref:NfeD-like C-terminal domain-containing protein n=3 Tax=Limnospira TaxID=2596745 RepID=A0A9P1KAJ0_9CYAN|nr:MULTISPECIES: hypothetical protein [Limnospira]EKD10113.1 hypothetical protein SPLC1_S101430 [Arthrospira platensis C1]MDC0840609.1 NfeD-like protein [Limnoraphis robusta]MDY7052025.1 NfeD-like protein [Limnospira fusiformis LS22]QJB28529.1 NfeD-like protein [Limnospira fusiformis SAG 85.79]EDZ95510.1 conserved hypothetical protein [Limnospira maxima CS-328]
MITLYIVCLTVGGVCVILAAVEGLDGVEFEGEFDSDVELEHRRDDTENQPSHRSKRKTLRLRLPFGSVRFWTFGVCFFGLTGTIMSVLNPDLTPAFVATAAIAIGVSCGTAVVWVFDILRSQQANSLVQSHDFIGLSAIVEIPFNRDSRGKVRLSAGGSVLYLSAITEENQEFSQGDRVFVVGMEKNKVLVVSEASFGVSEA